MLLSLQKDPHNELHASTSSLHSRIEDVEEHTDNLEKNVTEHTGAYNEVAEVQDPHSEEICYLQAKVAHLKTFSEGTISNLEAFQKLSNLLNSRFTTIIP